MNGRTPGTPRTPPPEGTKGAGGTQMGAPRGGVVLVILLALLAFGVTQVLFARPAASPRRFHSGDPGVASGRHRLQARYPASCAAALVG